MKTETKTCPSCGQLFFLGYPEQERCDLCHKRRKRAPRPYGRVKPDGKLRPTKKETK